MVKRIAAIVACSAAVLGSGAVAQVRPEISVEFAQTDEGPGVEVTLNGLFAEENFLNALESGFPLYLEYQVTLRRARTNWFDQSVADNSFEYVVFYDPVREIYVVEEPHVTEQYSTLRDLREKISEKIAFPITPQREGRYYFAATVVARTLSDEDVDEVFAWLRGENGDTTALERPGFVTRTARRLLIQVAPLPRITLQGRTEDFQYPLQISPAPPPLEK